MGLDLNSTEGAVGSSSKAAAGGQGHLREWVVWEGAGPAGRASLQGLARWAEAQTAWLCYDEEGAAGASLPWRLWHGAIDSGGTLLH